MSRWPFRRASPASSRSILSGVCVVSMCYQAGAGTAPATAGRPTGRLPERSEDLAGARRTRARPHWHATQRKGPRAGQPPGQPRTASVTPMARRAARRQRTSGQAPGRGHRQNAAATISLTQQEIPPLRRVVRAARPWDPAAGELAFARTAAGRPGGPSRARGWAQRDEFHDAATVGTACAWWSGLSPVQDRGRPTWPNNPDGNPGGSSQRSRTFRNWAFCAAWPQSARRGWRGHNRQGGNWATCRIR